MNTGFAEALVTRLDSIGELTDPERDGIRTLPLQIADLRADQDIVREGDRPSQCCLILDGFACIAKNLSNGTRQIAAFQMAGDIPDLLSIYLHQLDSSISTLTACRVAFVQHKDVRKLCGDFPGIAAALWRSTLIDGSIFREWIANVGQRPAPQRLAHVFCEFLVRMRAIGLENNQSCAFPITQDELGQATGMSPVHVNRSVTQLREDGLISLKERRLTALDWQRLSAFADFDPSYLHLREPWQARH